jgi:hypothetical protein
VNRVRRVRQPQQRPTGGGVTVVRMQAQRLTQHDPHEAQLLSKRAEAAIIVRCSSVRSHDHSLGTTSTAPGAADDTRRRAASSRTIESQQQLPLPAAVVDATASASF